MDFNRENFSKQNNEMLTAQAELLEIAKNPQKLKEMLEGSDINFDISESSEENFRAWEKIRGYIVAAIDKNGSLLDYGCANGFLLKSLQAWSTNHIDPYGVDIDDSRLKTAQSLFPGKEDHFFNVGEKGKDEFNEWLEKQKEFDFIHWNVWDNSIEEYINQETEGNSLEKMVATLKAHLKRDGKIILSSYHVDRETGEKFLTKLQQKWTGKLLKSEDKENFSFIIG